MKIFANLKDMEKAQNKAELKNGFSDDFVKDLEGKGISCDDIEGMCVRIGSNGDVSVDGIEDEGIREKVQELIDEKYGDRMYQYYIGIADSGFAVDMGALDGRFTPKFSGNMYSDMYKYQFKKVL